MNSASSDRPSSTIDPKLLEILVCPLTKGPLEYDAEKQELISRSAKLAYPIRDGIPIMLPEEARAPYSSGRALSIPGPNLPGALRPLCVPDDTRDTDSRCRKVKQFTKEPTCSRSGEGTRHRTSRRRCSPSGSLGFPVSASTLAALSARTRNRPTSP